MIQFLRQGNSNTKLTYQLLRFCFLIAGNNSSSLKIKARRKRKRRFTEKNPKVAHRIEGIVSNQPRDRGSSRTQQNFPGPLLQRGSVSLTLVCLYLCSTFKLLGGRKKKTIKWVCLDWFKSAAHPPTKVQSQMCS